MTYILSWHDLDIGISSKAANLINKEQKYLYQIPKKSFDELLNLNGDKEPFKWYKPHRNLRIRGREWNIDPPELMAILNFTSDSFYEKSRINLDKIEELSQELKNIGVKIIDIGGESTRPGSDPISFEEEWNRIEKPLKLFIDEGFIVSVDSYKPQTQRKALELGSHIINDVKGMESEEMGILAKKFDVPIILMHSKGDFKTMQENPNYENVILEIISFFMERLRRAERLGIEDNIILDPGIGFGKRVEDNLMIVKYLDEIKMGYFMLIGLSRKSFLGKILNETADERLCSTVIMNTVSILNGSDFIRVHDPKENLKIIELIKRLKNYRCIR
jgi:dihydropteroate synthase